MKTLAARGQPQAALAALEQHIAAQPQDAAAYLEAAELCTQLAKPRRAAALFAAVQANPLATAQQVLYATNRLVDLFLGPLNDPNRAAEELRQLIHRQPNTRAAQLARNALLRLE